MNYFRDNKKHEIDLIVEEDGFLHPVEIKLSSNPDKKATKNFALLKNSDFEVDTGAVICMSDAVIPISENTLIVPSNLI